MVHDREATTINNTPSKSRAEDRIRYQSLIRYMEEVVREADWIDTNVTAFLRDNVLNDHNRRYLEERLNAALVAKENAKKLIAKYREILKKINNS